MAEHERAERSQTIRNTRDPEWRHRVESMAYRRLGATGMMVSELVMGGVPITPESRNLLRVAMEKGINYFDTAPAYGDEHESERGVGSFLKETPGIRDQVFIATKLSDLQTYRVGLYEEVFQGLPSEKQNAIVARARELVEERAAGDKRYFFEYFPGQAEGLDWNFRVAAMQTEYGSRIDEAGNLRRKMLDTLDESLRRTGAGYYDVLHCPHGATTPESVEVPEMLDTFEEIRRAGKARFFGTSTHTSFDHVTRAVADNPAYDVVLGAYNVLNYKIMGPAITYASERGLGVIGMKACAAAMTHFDELMPIASWRAEKLDGAVSGDWTLPQKAYLFSLQHPGVSAVTSSMWNEAMVRENAAVAGHKVAVNLSV